MTSAGEHCIQFEYHMFGFHIGRLVLHRISNSDVSIDDDDFLWRRIGQKGNEWLHAAVNVTLTSTQSLAFVGHRAMEYSGDIGLDSLKLTRGYCS